MTTRQFTGFLVAGALVTFWMTATPALVAQDAQHQHGQASAQQPGAAAERQAAMAQMMAQMQASDKELDALVAQMNAATEPDKADRIAAVVNKLVDMHKQMSGLMQSGMMMQMMGGRSGSPQHQP